MILDIEGYDGTLLHNRFAYQVFEDEVNPAGDIIAFRGWMRVEAEGMIDQEDVANEDYIYAKDAINFMWEMPNLTPFAAVAYQRLLNREIADILETYLELPILVEGDDLMIGQEGKCSVSITHVKDHAALGHTAINIDAGDEAPRHAYSTHLTDDQAQEFMEDVIEMFYDLNQDIFVATSKVLV
tara:strand:+ start:109937 stop:110488 length:552 start_codon:yes stop_codon:yes gene_type:complete